MVNKDQIPFDLEIVLENQTLSLRQLQFEAERGRLRLNRSLQGPASLQTCGVVIARGTLRLKDGTYDFKVDRMELDE